MPFAMKLNDETCRDCGDEELIWWSKDETETHDEVYVTCDGCGYEYPKKVVKKSNDKDREEIARDIA